MTLGNIFASNLYFISDSLHLSAQNPTSTLREEKQKQKLHILAIWIDFSRACIRLLMILGSPGGTLSFKSPCLDARKIGAEFSLGRKTKQSIYTRTSVSPSPMVINPNLAPPAILSTCFIKLKLLHCYMKSDNNKYSPSCYKPAKWLNKIRLTWKSNSKIHKAPHSLGWF